jgi:dTDP-4-dehydrorhamnose reductase
MQPSILLIGKNGQVGWELLRALAPLARVEAVDYPEIDLGNPDAFRAALRSYRVDVIVNAAAYTAVDKAESESERCHHINAVAPGLLAEYCHSLGIPLVHYSTDYVFDGAKRSPYVEEDIPNPLNAYGRSKLAGDLAITHATPRHLIFRLCWVYGARGQNFLLTVRRLAREREQLRMVNDQTGSPTWSRMIAQATALALQQVLRATDRAAYWGVYHLSASGQTTWYEFTRAIVDQLPADQRRCREVIPITTPEYPTPARRPAYSVMSGEKLRQVFGLQLPGWETSLKQVAESG